MSPLRIALTAVIGVALAGCAELTRPPVDTPRATVSVEPPSKADAWMRIATEEDQSRIDRLGLAWQSALDDARRRHSADIRREGSLLEARGALTRPAPTPGSYNCRMIKLGRTTARGPVFERFRPFFCYVEADGHLLTIVKQTGSQRPAGRLWEDDREDRLIFLGSLALGNEDQPLAYGEDRQRDMAGILERIGPFRWRLVIPWPRGTSKLDIFELTPVADQPE